MVHRRSLLGAAAAGLALARPARASAWPPDRVTFVTSLPAGSTVDLTTRVYAERLGQLWGQPVVVDNRGGGNGVLACEMVARARPDGLTLLATSAMTHAANPAMYDRLPYDPVADFAAVARYGNSPFVVMAQKRLGTRTLQALIVRIRAEPGRHNYGEGSVPSRVATELFRMIAGLDVVHVGYRGNQAAFPDLLNGRLSFMSVDVIGAKPLVDAGEVDALALTAPERHPGVPGVPSCVEAGLPALAFTTWSGVYAPKAVPAEIVARINRDMARVYAMPEVAARFAQMGATREAWIGPEAFQRFTGSEMAAWGRIIRQAGMRVE
ncbi:MAG TPA: tripartite tricarboxylate transporter substrate binding protein [Crenalkalicoccus sp.]|nr:tripartite tricarboxylate transporter substrate binding protein [Crenalkalicoccus sp.]